ncbi:MAG: phage major capsid protein [Pseudomonadota bacterium]
MPLSYDQLSAITKKYYVPKLVDAIFDSDPLLKRYKDKGRYKKVGGGTSAMMPLNYALTTAAGWYSGTETLSTTDNDQISAAEYQWKQAYANITIARDDELKNSGDAQVIDLVKSKTQIAEKTLADYIQGGLYHSGSNSKSIVGTGLFLSTSNTVGGIAQGTYSWWQAQIDSSTTTLGLAAMQTIWNSCTINNSSPTVLMSTRSVFNKYFALLAPQQRFVDSETAKGGFQNLMFNGAPVIVGSKVPTANLQFLNEENLALLVMKEEDFRFEPFQKPVNQNAKTAKIYWMGAHGTDNCRMLGALTAITA